MRRRLGRGFLRSTAASIPGGTHAERGANAERQECWNAWSAAAGGGRRFESLRVHRRWGRMVWCVCMLRRGGGDEGFGDGVATAENFRKIDINGRIRRCQQSNFRYSNFSGQLQGCLQI